MPQMMPCSWLVIFLGSMLVSLVMSSNWSSFFFVSSLSKKGDSLVSCKKVIFWL